MGEAKPLENLADAALMVGDTKARPDYVGQVDTSPAHNPVMLRIGALQNDLREFIQLAGRQSALGAFRPLIDETPRAMCVEAVNPIAQGLTVHPANLGGRLTAHAVVNPRNRQQTAALLRILRLGRITTHLTRRKVFPQFDRSWHLSLLQIPALNQISTDSDTPS